MHLYKRWAIFAAALFLTISAALVSGYHLYFMAGMLLSLPLVSYVIGAMSMRGIEVERDIPPSGWDGEEAWFQLTVRSHSRLPRLYLQAADDLPEWLDPVEMEPAPFSVPPHSAVKVRYRVALRKRGAYLLEGITVTAFDPLGIYAYSQYFSLPAEFIVYPVPEPVPELILTGAERFGFRDLPVASTRGGGVDPDGVREYVPGDPLRRMHWKSTARTGKLNVIEFEESRSVNLVLALDLYRGSHAGHGRESSLEYLIRAAASLAEIAIRQGASVRLAAGGDAESENAGRGTDHLIGVLGGLARAEAVDARQMSETLADRVGHIPAGTTLIALASGLDHDLPAALAAYGQMGVRTVVVYADPSSFEPAARTAPPDEQKLLLDRFAAIQDALFVLRCLPGRPLNPEPWSYAEYLHRN